MLSMKWAVCFLDFFFVVNQYMLVFWGLEEDILHTSQFDLFLIAFLLTLHIITD